MEAERRSSRNTARAPPIANQVPEKPNKTRGSQASQSKAQPKRNESTQDKPTPHLTSSAPSAAPSAKATASPRSKAKSAKAQAKPTASLEPMNSGAATEMLLASGNLPTGAMPSSLVATQPPTQQEPISVTKIAPEKKPSTQSHSKVVMKKAAASPTHLPLPAEQNNSETTKEPNEGEAAHITKQEPEPPVVKQAEKEPTSGLAPESAAPEPLPAVPVTPPPAPSVLPPAKTSTTLSVPSGDSQPPPKSTAWLGKSGKGKLQSRQSVAAHQLVTSVPIAAVQPPHAALPSEAPTGVVHQPPAEENAPAVVAAAPEPEPAEPPQPQPSLASPAVSPRGIAPLLTSLPPVLPIKTAQVESVAPINESPRSKEATDVLMLLPPSLSLPSSVPPLSIVPSTVNSSDSFLPKRSAKPFTNAAQAKSAWLNKMHPVIGSPLPASLVSGPAPVLSPTSNSAPTHDVPETDTIAPEVSSSAADTESLVVLTDTLPSVPVTNNAPATSAPHDAHTSTTPSQKATSSQRPKIKKVDTRRSHAKKPRPVEAEPALDVDVVGEDVLADTATTNSKPAASQKSSTQETSSRSKSKQTTPRSSKKQPEPKTHDAPVVVDADPIVSDVESEDNKDEITLLREEVDQKLNVWRAKNKKPAVNPKSPSLWLAQRPEPLLLSEFKSDVNRDGVTFEVAEVEHKDYAVGETKSRCDPDNQPSGKPERYRLNIAVDPEFTQKYKSILKVKTSPQLDDALKTGKLPKQRQHLTNPATVPPSLAVTFTPLPSAITTALTQSCIFQANNSANEAAGDNPPPSPPSSPRPVADSSSMDVEPPTIPLDGDSSSSLPTTSPSSAPPKKKVHWGFAQLGWAGDIDTPEVLSRASSEIDSDVSAYQIIQARKSNPKGGKTSPSLPTLLSFPLSIPPAISGRLIHRNTFADEPPTVVKADEVLPEDSTTDTPFVPSAKAAKESRQLVDPCQRYRNSTGPFWTPDSIMRLLMKSRPAKLNQLARQGVLVRTRKTRVWDEDTFNKNSKPGTNDEDEEDSEEDDDFVVVRQNRDATPVKETSSAKKSSTRNARAPPEPTSKAPEEEEEEEEKEEEAKKPSKKRKDRTPASSSRRASQTSRPRSTQQHQDVSNSEEEEDLEPAKKKAAPKLPEEAPVAKVPEPTKNLDGDEDVTPNKKSPAQKKGPAPKKPTKKPESQTIVTIDEDEPTPTKVASATPQVASTATQVPPTAQAALQVKPPVPETASKEVPAPVVATKTVAGEPPVATPQKAPSKKTAASKKAMTLQHIQAVLSAVDPTPPLPLRAMAPNESPPSTAPRLTTPVPMASSIPTASPEPTNSKQLSEALVQTVSQIKECIDGFAASFSILAATHLDASVQLRELLDPNFVFSPLQQQMNQLEALWKRDEANSDAKSAGAANHKKRKPNEAPVETQAAPSNATAMPINGAYGNGVYQSGLDAPAAKRQANMPMPGTVQFHHMAQPQYPPQAFAPPAITSLSGPPVRSDMRVKQFPPAYSATPPGTPQKMIPSTPPASMPPAMAAAIPTMVLSPPRNPTDLSVEYGDDYSDGAAEAAARLDASSYEPAATPTQALPSSPTQALPTQLLGSWFSQVPPTQMANYSQEVTQRLSLTPQRPFLPPGLAHPSSLSQAPTQPLGTPNGTYRPPQQATATQPTLVIASPNPQSTSPTPNAALPLLSDLMTRFQKLFALMQVHYPQVMMISFNLGSQLQSTLSMMLRYPPPLAPGSPSLDQLRFHIANAFKELPLHLHDNGTGMITPAERFLELMCEVASAAVAAVARIDSLRAGYASIRKHLDSAMEHANSFVLKH